MSNITYYNEDMQPQVTSEGAIGYIYPLGKKWMAHSSYRAKGVQRSTKQDAIAHLAKCA